MFLRGAFLQFLAPVQPYWINPGILRFLSALLTVPFSTETATAVSASESPSATPWDASPAQTIVPGWSIPWLDRRSPLRSLLWAFSILCLALPGNRGSVCPAATRSPSRHGTASERSRSIKSWHISSAFLWALCP